MPQKSNKSQFAHTPLDNLPYPTFCLTQSAKTLNSNVKPKTLVVLFVWLNALERHIDKYRQLNLDKGYDVLSVRTKLTDALLPTRGTQIISRQAFEFLSEQHHQYDSIVFHSFSIGSYLMGELLVLLNREENKDIYSKIRPRMKGLILDSPVDFEWMGIGIARTFVKNSFLEWVIVTLFKVHFILFHHIAVKHYITASAIVHNNPHKYPTLAFLSKDDVVTNWKHMSGLVEGWRRNGVPLWVKCWDESPHVGHFYKYPQEYTELLEEFLNEVNKDDSKLC